jgi:thiol-disulfide isomerase/thioredoxin
MRPPRVRIAALALLVLPLLLAGCGPAEESLDEGREIPEDAADFRLPTLDGRTLGPPDFRGEVVVVDFWATWCTPCRAQAKVLEGLHAEWRDRGVRFLAVDVAEDRAKVEAFVAENPFPYPVLLDPEDRLSPKLGLIALPTLMVVNTEGEVTYLEPGLVDRRGLEKLFVEAGAEA